MSHNRSAKVHVARSSWVVVSLAAVPIFTSLFSRVLGRKLSLTECVGLAVDLAGVGCVSLRGGLARDPFGAGLLLISASFYAMGSADGGASARSWCHGLRVANAVRRRGAAARERGAGRVVGSLLARLAFAFAYLVVLGSMVAYTALGYLLRTVRPALATSYAFVNPIVALALGRALASEPLTRPDVIGLSLVLVAVALISRGKSDTISREDPSRAVPRSSAAPPAAGTYDAPTTPHAGRAQSAAPASLSQSASCESGS